MKVVCGSANDITVRTFIPMRHPPCEQGPADSRVRVRCDGYGRASGCMGRSEASGSCECCAPCVRCYVSYLILQLYPMRHGCGVVRAERVCERTTGSTHSMNFSVGGSRMFMNRVRKRSCVRLFLCVYETWCARPRLGAFVNVRERS